MIKCLHYVLTILIALNLFVICYAKTITVSKTESGDVQTITEAFALAGSGDVIKVGPGVYNENLIIDQSIFLYGSGPNFTTINSKINEVNDNVFHNAIYISSSNVQIIGFKVISNKSAIHSTSGVSNVIIKNCILTGSEYGFNSSISYINIFNNTIVDNIKSGIYFATPCNSPGGHVQIYGNIIANNGVYGIERHCVTIQCDYNNLYNNAKGNHNTSIQGTNSFSLDPSFIDHEEGNFVLKSDSPCINKGRPGDQDPDGSINDMGAYAGSEIKLFWPYPIHGPIVSELFISPISVPKGEKITIQVKGHIR